MRLRRQYGFLLAVDEAHATLVCGERGGGAAEAMGVAEQVSEREEGSCEWWWGGGGAAEAMGMAEQVSGGEGTRMPKKE